VAIFLVKLDPPAMIVAPEPDMELSYDDATRLAKPQSIAQAQQSDLVHLGVGTSAKQPGCC
jgi:hypothetical protein